MRRSLSTVAVGAAALLSIAACGGDSALTQEQTAEVLLTEEEFPLDGFTRGEVTEQDPVDDAESTESPDDSLAALLEGQDVEEACLEALESTDIGGEGIASESMVTFSGEAAEESMLPTEVELVVAGLDGESPLEGLAAVNDECGELELEDGGVTLTMSFEELTDLEGTRVNIEAMGQELTMTMGGRTEGDTVVAVLGLGVEEADVVQVVDAQMGKIEDLD